LATAGLAALLARPAGAAEVTRVVSGFDDGKKVDVDFTIGWEHDYKSAFIKREFESDGSARSMLIKDLKYSEQRDTLGFRADVGLLPDLGLHVALPLVLGDMRQLGFDQSSGNNCIFPGDPSGAQPTCVNEQNSTILRDGILPGYQKSMYGINSAGGSYARPSSTVFAGPKRGGFENLGIGVTWAVFNQRRDDTKPTWTVGFESKLDVFSDMAFDPARPGANTAVGPGYHQLIWSTWVSKRFRYFEPYVGASYMLPIRTNDSIYKNISGASWNSNNPQQVATLVAGVEQIAWEDPAAHQSVSVELHGHAEEHFFGRSASELWEPLAGSSACKADPGPSFPDCRPGLDLGADGRPAPYAGVTETQAYGTFGADIALNIHVGKHVRFRGMGGLTLDMPHFITYGTANTGNYRELIDLPGRRFRVEGTEILSGMVEGSILF
jgi:hypothetical protein